MKNPSKKALDRFKALNAAEFDKVNPIDPKASRQSKNFAKRDRARRLSSYELRCRHCGSSHIVANGHRTRTNGEKTPRYKCQNCKSESPFEQMRGKPKSDSPSPGAMRTARYRKKKKDEERQERLRVYQEEEQQKRQAIKDAFDKEFSEAKANGDDALLKKSEELEARLKWLSNYLSTQHDDQKNLQRILLEEKLREYRPLIWEIKRKKEEQKRQQDALEWKEKQREEEQQRIQKEKDSYGRKFTEADLEGEEALWKFIVESEKYLLKLRSFAKQRELICWEKGPLEWIEEHRKNWEQSIQEKIQATKDSLMRSYTEAKNGGEDAILDLVSGYSLGISDLQDESEEGLLLPWEKFELEWKEEKLEEWRPKLRERSVKRRQARIPTIRDNVYKNYAECISFEDFEKCVRQYHRELIELQKYLRRWGDYEGKEDDLQWIHEQREKLKIGLCKHRNQILKEYTTATEEGEDVYLEKLEEYQRRLKQFPKGWLTPWEKDEKEWMEGELKKWL